MKKFMISAMIALIPFSMIGCTENEHPPVQFHDQENHNSELHDYFISDSNAEVNSTEDQITWKMDTLSVTVTKSSSTIDSMQVSNGSSQHDIAISKEIQSNEADLTSIALSPSKKYIAINIFLKNVGNQLIVVNLTDGSIDTLNKMDRKYSEEIHSYNWSPVGNKLAFSYGDTSSSKLAILDFDQEQLRALPDQGLINTLFIMWYTDGTGFDFISESPSDEFKLYRYEESTNSVDEIAPVPLDELSKYNEFVPETL